MKVDKNLFLQFLNKLSIDGRIESCVLNFKEEGIFARTSDKNKYFFMSSNIDASFIEEYKAIGEIGIKDIKKLSSMAAAFKAYFYMDIDKNMITLRSIGGNKKIQTTLADKSFIGITGKPNIPYENSLFHLKTNELKEIKTDAQSIFGKSDKDSSTKSIITFLCEKEGELCINIDSGTNKIQKRIVVSELKHKFKVSFGDRIFSNMVNCLSAESVSITAQTNFPMKIAENDRIKSIFYIAPRIMEEGEEE